MRSSNPNAPSSEERVQHYAPSFNLRNIGHSKGKAVVGRGWTQEGSIAKIVFLYKLFLLNILANLFSKKNLL